MKFRYYITAVDSGTVLGTDSESDAESFSKSEAYFVVDSEKGLWLTSDGELDIEDIAT